jgi:hypothetical protein
MYRKPDDRVDLDRPLGAQVMRARWSCVFRWFARLEAI